MNDRRVMRALHLVRRGMLGELLHAECGYRHDLRAIRPRFHLGRWKTTPPLGIIEG